MIHHNEHRVPYLINGTTWVAYDDPESIAEKVNKRKQTIQTLEIMKVTETVTINLCTKFK